MIESKHALARELQTFQRRLEKQSTDLAKTLWHLGNQEFKCPSDAEKSMKPLLKSLKYHQIHYQIIPIERYAEKGHPKSGAQKEVVAYKVEATYSSCLEKIKVAKQALGRFILATNQLDETVLDNHSVLKQYMP